MTDQPIAEMAKSLTREDIRDIIDDHVWPDDEGPGGHLNGLLDAADAILSRLSTPPIGAGSGVVRPPNPTSSEPDMTNPDEAVKVEAAIGRIEQRVLSSEAACEGETASWADRARQKDADIRIVLASLAARAEENERLRSELNKSWLEWFRAVDHLHGFAEANNDDITTETLAIFYVADQARHSGDVPAVMGSAEARATTAEAQVAAQAEIIGELVGNLRDARSTLDAIAGILTTDRAARGAAQNAVKCLDVALAKARPNAGEQSQ